MRVLDFDEVFCKRHDSPEFNIRLGAVCKLLVCKGWIMDYCGFGCPVARIATCSSERSATDLAL